jgi:hypothetical protein
MALTIQIQPVTIVTQVATKLSCYVINYDLQAQSCILYWWLSDDNDNRLYDGNYSVPSEVLQEWNNDDSIIIHALANNNGFTIVE